MVSFLTELPNFNNVPFPLNFPIIAPLYTDVDLSGTGSVFYRYGPLVWKGMVYFDIDGILFYALVRDAVSVFHLIHEMPCGSPLCDCF